MSQELVVGAHYPAGTVVTVQENLSHIAQTTLQSTIDTARQQTQWSWYDVMIGLRELGIEPSETEELRIKKALFTKKLKYLLQKERGML